MKMNSEEIFICPNCGLKSQVIWVHGHGQCAVCKVNIDECCRGEQCSHEQEMLDEQQFD